MNFPHLTDTESVRQEASTQYGGLNDAAALVSSHKASLDPNVEANALKKMNVAETEKVQEDLDLAQAKVDEEHGEGTYRVIDAVVRGHALSTIVEDAWGRPKHVTVGWTDKFRPLTRPADAAAEAANAEAEAARVSLGAEVRQAISAAVEQARTEIEAKYAKLFAEKSAEVTETRDETLSKIADDEGSEDDDKGGGTESEGDDDVKYPRTQDDLDALAEKSNFEWPEGVTKVKDKQEALRKAGVKPEE
jgi:hypothetical protein